MTLLTFLIQAAHLLLFLESLIRVLVGDRVFGADGFLTDKYLVRAVSLDGYGFGFVLKLFMLDEYDLGSIFYELLFEIV